MPLPFQVLPDVNACATKAAGSLERVGRQDDHGRARRRAGDRRLRDRRPRRLGPQRQSGRPRHRHAAPRRRRRQLADLRLRRQQPRLRPVRHPPRRRSSSRRSRRTSRRGRSRSRTRTSTSTAASTTGRSSAPPSPTPRPARSSQGASTITQQLVRNLYIDDPEDNIERKIQEAAMAQQYENEHSKNQILNEYLNTATYGTNIGKSAVGVEAAAEVYFDKSVEDLGLPRVGDARRAAAGAVGVQPVHEPERGDQAPQRGPRRDGRPGLHHAGEGREGEADRSRAGARRQVPDPLAAVLLRLRPERADRQVRPEDRPPGRAARLYDAEPDRPGGGRAGDRQRDSDLRRRAGARLDRHQHRRDPRDGVLAVLRHEPVQPRRQRRAPARLVVQAVRADDRGRSGDRPRHDRAIRLPRRSP